METSYAVMKIPMSEIYSDSDFNCRGRIVPIDVIDLAKSIKDHGLQQPIIVQPFSNPEKPQYKYRIVSGHRRHASHIVNKSDTIDCVIKHDLTELVARKLNLEENLKRKDLNILQEAKAIEHFKKNGWPADMISRELGMSRGWVDVRLIVLGLEEDIQLQCAAGFFTQENIRQIASVKGEKRYEVVRKIKDAKLSGEKAVLDTVLKKPKDYLVKKLRKREEIFDMIELVIDVMGGSFATRFASWCAGEISDVEFFRDMKEECDKEGIRWEIPREAKDALNVGI